MRVCFAVPHAYALFDASSRLPFGGAEVRAWMFGTALARRADTQVSFVARSRVRVALPEEAVAALLPARVRP